MRPLIALFVAASAAVAGADEMHTIKLKLNADVGKTTQHRSKSVDKGVRRFMEADGKLLSEDKPEGQEYRFRQTVLQFDAKGQWTKFLRVYEIHEERENGETKRKSHAGRTVLFEKMGDGFRVGAVGSAPLDVEDIRMLLKRANEPDKDETTRQLNPGMPVRIGDTWQLKMAPLVESHRGMKADLAKSHGTARLAKILPKGNAKFGEFEHEGVFAVTGMDLGDGVEVVFDPPGEIRIKGTTVLAIDGSSTERVEKTKGSTAMKGVMKGPAGTFRIEMNEQSDSISEVSAELEDPKARVVPKVAWAADPDAWVAFKPKDGMFAVDFPVGPKEESKNVAGGAKTQYEAEVQNGNVLYMAVVTPIGGGAPADPKEWLRAFAKTGNRVGGETTFVEQDGHAGIVIKNVQVEDGVTITTTRKAFAVNDRLLALLVIANKDFKSEPEKFFKSLKINEKAKKKGK